MTESIPLNQTLCAARNKKLYLNEAMADVHFVFNSDQHQQTVPANRSILAANSLVFESMFYGDLKEESDVEIVDATVDAFKEFLQFFYLAEVRLTVENIAEVIYLLNKYDLLEHNSACEEFLTKNLTEENFIVAINLAIAFDREYLKQICAENIGVRSKKIFASDAFRQCSLDHLKFILQVEKFNCSESQIFDACITWAENACLKNNLDVSAANCRDLLGDCLYLIQFEKMTSNEVQLYMSKYVDLFDKSDLVEPFQICTSDVTVKSKFVTVNRIYLENMPLPFCVSGPRAINIARKMGKQPPDKYWMPQQESLFFYVNKRLLLGALSFHLYSNVATVRELEGFICIRKFSLDTDNDDNILLKETIIFNVTNTPGTYTYKLPETLSVKPNCPYEIRFNFSNWREETFVSFKSSGHGLVRKDEYRIFFGQCTKAAVEIGMESFISTLHFNRL